MNPELILISLLLVVSNLYWMRHSQRLVDKLMSRDFYEYKTAETKKQVERPVKKAEIIPENMGPLQDFIF